MDEGTIVFRLQLAPALGAVIGLHREMKRGGRPAAHPSPGLTTRGQPLARRGRGRHLPPARGCLRSSLALALAPLECLEKRCGNRWSTTSTRPSPGGPRAPAMDCSARPAVGQQTGPSRCNPDAISLLVFTSIDPSPFALRRIVGRGRRIAGPRGGNNALGNAWRRAVRGNGPDGVRSRRRSVAVGEHRGRRPASDGEGSHHPAAAVERGRGRERAAREGQRHQLPRRPGDARHRERLLHLVRQLVRQHGDRPSSPTSPRASAARRTTTSTPPTTTARTSTCRTRSPTPGAPPTTTRTAPRSPTPQIQAIVAAAITGRLPNDTNGVYFVLTSADVNATSRLLHPVLRLAHPRRPSAAATSSTRSSATRTAARPRAPSRPPARTATPAPTAWPRSSPTSSRRR